MNEYLIFNLSPKNEYRKKWRNSLFMNGARFNVEYHVECLKIFSPKREDKCPPHHVISTAVGNNGNLLTLI